MGKFLSREQMLAASGRQFSAVEIEGLGTLRLVTISAGKAIAYQALAKRQEKGEDVEAELVTYMLSATCVDERGKPLFTEATAREWLDEVSPEVMQKVVAAVTAYVTATLPAAPAPKPGEEAAPLGNSVASPSSGSPTGSA